MSPELYIAGALVVLAIVAIIVGGGKE